MAVSPVSHTHLRALGLHAPQAVGPVDDGVLRDHLVRVDVAAGPDDAAARQDHVPANKRCQGEGERGIPVNVVPTAFPAAGSAGPKALSKNYLWIQ